MLQIVVDERIEDKNRDLFVKALIGGCKRHGIEYTIVKTENTFAINRPYVVTEPNNFNLVLRKRYDCDNFATARGIITLLPDEPTDILLIGRGKLIGRPLIDFITDTTNHTLSILNSKTHKDLSHLRMCEASIIINSSTSEIQFDSGSMMFKILIDVNNNFKHKYNAAEKYDMRDLGKITVDTIMNTYKKITE